MEENMKLLCSLYLQHDIDLAKVILEYADWTQYHYQVEKSGEGYRDRED